MGSTRGIGHEWTRLEARDVPVLFGGGGWQDGLPAFMPDPKGKNTQIVEAVAIADGMGERALDVPVARRDVESTANANDEFDYSQFKTGHGNPDEAYGKVRLTTVLDGNASGDMLYKVDPRSDVFDQTLSALGAIHGALNGSTTKEDVDMDASSKPVADGMNPFSARKHVDVVDDSGREYKQPTEEYMYNAAKPSLTAQQQRLVNTNEATGLRRVNIKANTGTLLERMASKQKMMQSYQTFTEHIDEEFGAYNKAHVRAEDRERLLAPGRFEGADMVATQVNVANLSQAQALKFQRSKHTGKLAAAVVGV